MARHKLTVRFQLGSRRGMDIVTRLIPLLLRIPRPVAQSIVDLLLYPSHTLWRKDGNSWQRGQGWQLQDDGALVLGMD